MSSRFPTRFDHPTHPGVSNGSPSLTQQHFKSECDINTIMKKYAITGTLPNVAGGYYDEVPDDTDYFTLQTHLLNADDAFMSLPSHVRKRFENSPGRLLEFIHNPANLDEAVSLGLLTRNESSLPLKKEEENPLPEK